MKATLKEHKRGFAGEEFVYDLDGIFLGCNQLRVGVGWGLLCPPQTDVFAIAGDGSSLHLARRTRPNGPIVQPEEALAELKIVVVS